MPVKQTRPYTATYVTQMILHLYTRMLSHSFTDKQRKPILHWIVEWLILLEWTKLVIILAIIFLFAKFSVTAKTKKEESERNSCLPPLIVSLKKAVEWISWNVIVTTKNNTKNEYRTSCQHWLDIFFLFFYW